MHIHAYRLQAPFPWHSIDCDMEESKACKDEIKVLNTYCAKQKEDNKTDSQKVFAKDNKPERELSQINGE